MARRRVAVLISGGGSNLQALIEATARATASAQIALVISNRADAFGIRRAEQAGIPATVIEHDDFATPAAFEAEIDARLHQAKVELVCLAGFMRVLTEDFVQAWQIGRAHV